MDNQTLKRLEKAGFVATSVAEFLELSPAQEALIETKLQLSALLKQTRRKLKWTQARLAKALETSQQAIARAERGETVTLDFLHLALMTMGVSRSDIADQMRALDGELNPVTAAPCAATSPISESEGAIETREQTVVVAAQTAYHPPSAPMLQIIRGGNDQTFETIDGSRSHEEREPVAKVG